MDIPETEISFKNRGLRCFSRLQGLPAKLPDCFLENPYKTRLFKAFLVCTKSLSYYVGEGTIVPSPRGRRRPISPNPQRLSIPGLSILALDLGTTTGWALHSREGLITSGTENFKPQRFEGGGMRYLRFRRWLTELRQSADGLDAVFFEEVRRHAGVDAAHAYGGFMAQLTAWAEHQAIPYQGVPVGTIKKHATGKGNAGKAEMM